MKVGITINDYYKRYLEEIAKLNNLSITGICGLIVENFISYNKNKNRYPLFQRQVNIVFANEKSDNKDSNVSPVVSSVSDLDSSSGRILSKEELLAAIEESHQNSSGVNPEEDELPF